MNPHEIPEAGPLYLFFLNLVEWLNPAVYFAGLAVAVWAFMRCRKWGYLVVALYFGIILFSLFALPSINRAIRTRHTPDISEQTQQKVNAAVQEAIERVLEDAGHPVIAAKHTVHFPFGPILLVVGLWFIARREPQEHRCNNDLHQTAVPPDAGTTV